MSEDLRNDTVEQDDSYEDNRDTSNDWERNPDRDYDDLRNDLYYD